MKIMDDININGNRLLGNGRFGTENWSERSF